MINFIQCVRRKPGLPLTEFRAAWQEYGKIARELAEEVGATRLSLSSTLAVDANLSLMADRGVFGPFDGVLEMRLESAPAVIERLGRPGVREQLEALQKHQEEFMDLAGSSFFFTVEEVLFDSEE